MRKRPMSYYIQRMKNNLPFAQVGYSDAEWFCMIGIRIGNTTGLGQVLSSEHGKLLLDVLVRRQDDRNFLFTRPCCLDNLPQLECGKVDYFLQTKGISCGWLERDMITDELARRAGLNPFIKQLRKMDVVFIGNAAHRGLDFLNYKYFVEIPTPNCHLEEGAIDKAVKDALSYGQSATYLVSGGVSTAIIVDRLYDKIPGSFFFDCGSIWDAFVGIGGQRDWRAKLYAAPDKLKEWKEKNLEGI